MKKEREVIRMRACEFTDAGDYFERLAGFPPDHVPAKYGDGVESARKVIAEGLELAIIFNCEEVAELKDNEVVLGCGLSYTGDMPPKILKDSDYVVNYVITLCGYSELKNTVTDIMTEYFMDAWGTAYTEAAQGWLGRYIKEELAKEGLKRTHLWSPGQHHFSLANQKTLFQILTPEDQGCTLTNNLMMVPVKSVSGIIGITAPDAGKQLLPCDFCSLGASCPASKRGCAEL